MALPVTIPNAFANATASIPLSQLDANFNTLANAVNGISDGSETLANVTATVGNITTVNATTVDTTNIEVTNIKAKDGTAAGSIADSTGVVTLASSVLTTTDINGGTIDGTAIGGASAAAVSATTLNTSGAVVFNDSGADVDFRVEGDTDANLLFVDASTDRVGIGTSTPLSKLEVSTTGAAAYRFQVSDTTNDNTLGTYSDSTNIRHISVNNARSSYKQYGIQANGIIFSATNGNESARIDSSGRVYINTTASIAGLSSMLSIDAPSAVSGIVLKVGTDGNSSMRFLNAASSQVGSVVVNASTTAFNTSSDYRLKENVAPMTGALAKVLELNPVTYTWKADGSAGEGFIAHELAEVCPDAVTGEKDATEIQQVEVSPAVEATYDEEGNELTPAVEAVYEEREVPVYQGVDTSFLVATLTAAIQELKAELDAAKERIAALENA